jgi:predicted branched-subunit amino acid permease
MSRMREASAALWRHPEFGRGVREMRGVAFGIAAWGLVTGVAMGTSGLGWPLAVLMSLLVFAGSAQLAVLPLLATGAPLPVVWATALCVNLRFVIFSAQWRPYFGVLPRRQRVALIYLAADLNYVLFAQRFPEARPEPSSQVPYFLGGAVLNWLAWQVPSIAGIFLADHIPAAWGFGFAGTLALLGIACALLDHRAAWVAAVVAGTAAVAAYALPLKLNMLVAIAAAVAVGVVMDRLAPRAGAKAEGAPR